MGSWNQFADQYGADKALAALDAEQIHAVIDMLLLVMYADGKASMMERIEFEALIQKLPAMEGKADIVAAQVENAIERARATSGDEIERLAKTTAARVTDPAARELVFRMAATLATADLSLALPESAVLTALATAFGLPKDAAQRIIDSTN
jgi:uncharacterized tellurite resistance protein B-like protein